MRRHIRFNLLVRNGPDAPFVQGDIDCPATPPPELFNITKVNDGFDETFKIKRLLQKRSRPFLLPAIVLVE